MQLYYVDTAAVRYGIMKVYVLLCLRAHTLHIRRLIFFFLYMYFLHSSSLGSLEGITMLKLLFGLSSDLDPGSDSYNEKLSHILKLIKALEIKISEDSSSGVTIDKSISHQV